jgi:hypothetical protein
MEEGVVMAKRCTDSSATTIDLLVDYLDHPDEERCRLGHCEFVNFIDRQQLAWGRARPEHARIGQWQFGVLSKNRTSRSNESHWSMNMTYPPLRRLLLPQSFAYLVVLSKLASWNSRGLDRSEGRRGLEGNMSRFDSAEKIVDFDVRYCIGGTLEL